MADADEIPLSAAEKAFLDAMNPTNDVQEPELTTTTTTNDVTAPATTTTTETNGHEPGEGGGAEEGDGDRERPTTQGEAPLDEGEDKSSSVPATSAQSSVVPSVASPTTSTTSVPVHDPPSAVPVSVVSRDQVPESTPSVPATPSPNQSAPAKAPQPTTQAARPQKPASGGKRKRLPQDLVGQLEDRIAENSRGDVDAWLALIEEHRRKGKFVDAREVYERFFVIFPQAVSSPKKERKKEILIYSLFRPNNGLITSRWNLTITN